MDPVTHMSLGALAGAAVPGTGSRRKAALIGSLIGCMPDLDLVPALFLDPIGRLIFHRGITHSLAFAIIASPILGFAIMKILREDNRRSLIAWSLVSLAALSTHIAVDCLTTYGTRVFLPFSDYRAALSIISFCDPLFTIPLAAAAIALVLPSGYSAVKKYTVIVGCLICSLYLAFAVVNKITVHSVFMTALRAEGHDVQRIFTSPTPFNNLLWLCVAEGRNEYAVGYYSLLDNVHPTHFVRVPRRRFNHSDKASHAVRVLEDYSNGFYTVDRYAGALLFHDLRYGFAFKDNLEGKNQPIYLLSYVLMQRNGGWILTKKDIAPITMRSLSLLIKRIVAYSASES